MKNKYKVKINKKSLKILKEYWSILKDIEMEFSQKIRRLEEDMEHTINIKGIEFFSCDGEYVGISNADRTMELIQYINMKLRATLQRLIEKIEEAIREVKNI